MKYYEITFVTKKGGYKNWVINVEANTTTEAKEKMLNMWGTDRRFEGMHTFHIKVRALKDTENFKYNYFSLKGE